jgi:hypothetical protein
VRYVPDLLSLSEARELLVASGQRSPSEAEANITRALRERKIWFRRTIERVTFRGHTVHPESFRRKTFEDGNRFRRRVPADLAPEDLDWENSRPRKPWSLGEGYFAHIARLELWRKDLDRVFGLIEAPQEKHSTASKPSAAEVKPHSEARSQAARKAGNAGSKTRRAKAAQWREWVTEQAPPMRRKYPTSTQEDLADKLIASATKAGIALPQRKTVVAHLSVLERAGKILSRTTDPH